MWRARTVQGRLAMLLTVATLVLVGASTAVAIVISDRDRQIEVVDADDATGRAIAELSYEVTHDPARAQISAQADALAAKVPSTTARARIRADLATLMAKPTDATTRERVAGALRDQQLAVRTQRDTDERRLKASIRDVTQAIILSLVAIVAVLVVAVVRLRAWTTVPLRALGASVRQLTDGHLAEPVAVRGPHDFIELGREVERLRLSLLHQGERSAQAEEALAQAPPVLESLRRQLVPQHSLTELEGVTVGFASRPAEGIVAGDWCDVVGLEGGLVGLVVGDVSGHGVDPGLVALQAKLLLTAALQRGLDPSRTISWTHNQLAIADDTILTCWVGLLNPRTRSLRYANAGHPTGWHRRADGTVEPLVSNGTLISTLGGKWATEETLLAEDSLLLLLTDGILESRNAAGEQLGEDGVLHVMGLTLEAGDAGPVEVAEDVLLTARQHCAGRLGDDATVLAVQLTGVSRP